MKKFKVAVLQLDPHMRFQSFWSKLNFRSRRGSGHAPANGGPIFPGTILFLFFYNIKIFRLAFPGVMSMPEMIESKRKRKKRYSLTHEEQAPGHNHFQIVHVSFFYYWHNRMQSLCQ